uniref:Putative nonsense-mediated mrna decay protein n=1 Tax=Ixodes ricinus TaxID=34613 RepID=A0A131XZR4_IXORI
MGLLQKNQVGRPDTPSKPGMPGDGFQCTTEESMCQQPSPSVRDLSRGSRCKRPDQPMYVPKHVKTPPADRCQTEATDDTSEPKSSSTAKSPYLDGPPHEERPAAEDAAERLNRNGPGKPRRFVGAQQADGDPPENSASSVSRSPRPVETGLAKPKQNVLPVEPGGSAGDWVRSNATTPREGRTEADRSSANNGRRSGGDRGSGRRSGGDHRPNGVAADLGGRKSWSGRGDKGGPERPPHDVFPRQDGRPTGRAASPRRRKSGSEDEAEDDSRRRSSKRKSKKKKGRPREDRPRRQSGPAPHDPAPHDPVVPSGSGSVPEEEDWDGDLMVVEPSGRTFSQEDLSRTADREKASPVAVHPHRRSLGHRNRDSFSEEEKDAGVPHVPAYVVPVIKDWSVAVVEEEERRLSAERESSDNSKSAKESSNRRSSARLEVRRKNRRNDSFKEASPPPKAPQESQVPPRFQKRSPLSGSAPEPGVKGGLIRIPCDVTLTPKQACLTAPKGPLEDCGAEREPVPCNLSQDKPLIAVKPQPHVALEATPGRAAVPPMPGFGVPYGVSPPILSPPYPGLPLGQYPCHLPAHGPSPVFHGDQILPLDAYGRSRMKPLVEKNLHDAALLERELMTHLAKGIQNSDMKAMGHCRWKLQLRYENVILADPRYCAEKNVEHALWKSAFYQGIETFRRVMEECPDLQEEAKMHLLSLVDEGTIFYENLLDKFQETYGFSLSQFLEPESASVGGMGSGPGVGGTAGLPDSLRLVLISAQKIYICLGDLARYREQAMGTTNYGRARSWYLKAQQIAPKNGRPYNQLAILALYARRKLDAVYYYMRSLAASNPFLTARESLLALFDDARKKYEHLEKKRGEEEGLLMEGEQSLLRRLSEMDQERLEVWIRPDGSTSHRSSRSSDLASRELDQLARLSTVELNKRFVLSFLHVHGKLFTRVGMETFPETARRMLLELRCLLQRTPAAVGSVRHLQLLSINMFTVANTSLKDRTLDPQCRSLLQEQSLQVALAHVAILLERATGLVLQGLQTGSSPSSSSSSCSPSSSPGCGGAPSQLSDDLAELLPCLKVWTDWMSCQKRLWSPPPSPCDYDTGVKGNVWTTLADFLTVLRRLNMADVRFFKDPAEDRELVTLPEDATLAGFVPLLGAPQETFYVQLPCDRERARNHLRMSRVQFFGDYLCGIATPYLEFNVERKRFVSLIATCDSESDSEREITYDSSEEELGDSLDDQEVSLKSGEEENEIQKLWSKKEQLRRAKEQRERQQACVQAVLQEHRSKQAAMLEIRPRNLVPDTNCFIDHLPLLQRLVADGHFQVFVPIVVVNELYGLARGTRQGPHQSPDHSQKVALAARAAVSYLEERFDHRESKLKAITSRGSVMDTISFRSEDVTDNKGTNDDLILASCLHFCKDRTEHLLPREPDAPVKLYRETVLITEDRNLCVKALTHHVPVRDLPAFLRWANIS